MYCCASTKQQQSRQINEELAKSNFVFFYRIELNLHLIGQKMNHQAGILRIITKNEIQQRSKKRFSRSNLVENRKSKFYLGPELTRNLQNRISIFFFKIKFNLHLIGQNINHQAGVLRIITKNQIQQTSKKRLSRSNFVENRNSI